MTYIRSIGAMALAAILPACATTEAAAPAKPATPVAAAAAPAAPPAPVTPPPAATPAPVAAGPAIVYVAKPNYVSIPMEITVNKSAKDVWARIGKYCDISEWLQIAAGCKITAGTDGDVGAVRSVASEILVGKTELSYIYTQPARDGRPYNLYHGTLEARPLTPTTSKIVYTLMFDNSMLADDAARTADLERRRTTFMNAMNNMKILAEGGTLTPRPPSTTPPPAAATPAAPPLPAVVFVEKPTYVSIPMEIMINKPAKDVWARVGKYCDIAEWFQIAAGCKITSGKDGEFGAVRTVGEEILVGKTELSYTYTQPARDGRPYNLYHGTLEARPVTATTTKMVYTLMFDNSMLADDAARKADLERRRTRFMQGMANMKTLAEGGTLPPPPAPAAPAAPATRN